MRIHIPKILDPVQCRSMCDKLNATEETWQDGRVTAGHQGIHVKDNQQIAENSSIAHELGDVILSAIECHPLFISAVLPHRVYPPMFNRYTNGMQFGNHIDGAVRLVPDTGLKLRTDISATLFLTSPDEYDGGELCIEDADGTHTIKLPVGDMIVYSSRTVHRVNPVTQGVRIAAFFWIQSMIRDDTQRALLFDLDTAIQCLNMTDADQSARIQLTGCYHNLLRQWAEL